MIDKNISRKSQIMSTDMIYGVIVFVLLVTVFIGIFLYSALTKEVDKYDYEIDYLFLNLEKNVGQLDESMIFIKGSRIYADKLTIFSGDYKDESIDELVVGRIGNANGIGLDTSSYDVCLYLTDNDMAIIDMGGGVKYIGRINGVSCQDIIDSGKNPCDEFKDAISLFKPILLDEGDAGLNRVIQMNLVACRK